MPGRRRSPFGEMLYQHRRRLGLSQRDLADRAFRLAQAGADVTPVSERTILSLERAADDPEAWRTPRPATARSIARALGFSPGTPEHDALLEAAGSTHHPPSPPPVAGFAFQPYHVPAPEFVVSGREPHLERLHRAIDATAQGAAGAIFVGADPGTGKTWLVAEACREGLERFPGACVLWTQCADRASADLPHEPFQRMLSLMLADLDAASPRELLTDANAAELRRRVPIAARALLDEGAGLLRDIVPGEALRSPTLAAATSADLRRQLDVAARRPPPRAQRRDDLHEALYRVLARHASAGPVILVLEDLHWADDDTLAALSHLLTRLHGQLLPVLLIGTWRPGEPGSHDSPHAHTLASVLRTVPRMYPDALLDLSTAVGGDAGRAFVDAVVARSGMPDAGALAASLFQRTAGMPLFVMSLLRLYEQERRAGRLDATVPMTGRIPAEIESVFAEQLLRLPDEVQRLLEAASIQGSTFLAEVVMEMLALPRAAFIDMVDSRLVRQFRMLLPGGTRSVAGETAHVYQFSHALLRDVLGHRMSDLQRAHYHALTAGAMRARYGDSGHDAVEAIAYHLEQSGEQLGAAEAYLNAADHALNNHEISRAIRLFAHVESMNIRAAHPRLTIRALIGLGNCERRRGNPRQARALLERAGTLATEYHLNEFHANVQESLGLIDLDTGEIQAGIQRLRAAIRLWEGERDEDASRAMVNLCFLLHGAGRYDEAIALATRAQALASRLDDQRMWLDCQIAISSCRLELGLYADAAASYRDAIDVCREIGDHHREHVCRSNLVLVALETGDLPGCLAQADTLLDPAEELSEHLTGYVELYLGTAHLAKDDLPSAASHLERSRRIREQIGQDGLLIDSVAGLLQVATAQGDRQRASELLGDVQQRIEERGLDGVEHAGRLFLALIGASTLLGDEDGARDTLRRAAAYLRGRADRLADPDHRASYLANPPTHRRIVQMAREAGVW